MTSVMAQQLQALGKSGVSLPRGKGRPSLLFEAHQAADIDLQTIYEIALQGASIEKCFPALASFETVIDGSGYSVAQ